MNKTISIASVVVATILVAGALVLPYNYAMAGGNGSNHQPSKHIQLTKIDIKKSVQAIKLKVESKARGGNANGGAGGTSTGGPGGTSTGGNSGASTGGNGGSADGGINSANGGTSGAADQWCCYKRWRNS